MNEAAKVDVHMLLMGNEDPVWLDKCKRSLQNEPVNVFYCDGIPGNIALARSKAYKKGTAPYVSFVDPDDFVYPGAFDACLDILEKHPEVVGVCTAYNAIGDCSGIVGRNYTGPLTKKDRIHQLVVMRREAVMHVMPLVERFPMAPEEITFSLLWAFGEWWCTDFIGYAWRIHDKGIHHQPHTDRLRVTELMHALWLDDTYSHDYYKKIRQIPYDKIRWKHPEKD